MSDINFMSYDDALDVLGGYANVINSLKPEETTWAQWNAKTESEKEGHVWLITDAPDAVESVHTFLVAASSWIANAGSDATAFPYVCEINTEFYTSDFVPNEVLLLGADPTDYPTAADETAIGLVDKYVKFTGTAIRLRATSAPATNLNLVVRG